MKLLGVNSFALRQFVEGYRGSYIPRMSPYEFLRNVNNYIIENNPTLVDGYADFCKHIFIPNFTEAKQSIVKITNENEKYIKTGYISRRDEEIPVLSRWFPKDSPPASQLIKSKYLDIILYSKEQCEKESSIMNCCLQDILDDKEKNPDWYIISIKAQNESFEVPMEPITILRNTLIEEGGSGVPLKREKYLESVEFWKEHAIVFS
ncbi:unnamed protein product [Cryptosporidium hominis]|uniref:Uncharacterized protein n=1 Tax=Cryptosporidium hominis TaxID=237895 RepID=A0A0S4TE06_CRYHO|nr:hypothetical protein [Cryptosporidium hominis TU502]OLQ19078.1 hypothetical protein ChTU502y2012_418g0085 [Cryptosporidium hominis]PPA65751.1 Protein of unknown function (DUF3228) family protein [Cryptosporidium hominis]PPS95034.1 Uncharacterized protein GY17_00002155 [Cryptosporidium hominis]CUV04558.1 unnamed protein product [Cryptosporidium hominis]|eukprot:PPS95034.1 Uncharacterized protein GY17_00002155 [Cryptosporidium hominis]